MYTRAHLFFMCQLHVRHNQGGSAFICTNGIGIRCSGTAIQLHVEMYYKPMIRFLKGTVVPESGIHMAASESEVTEV